MGTTTKFTGRLQFNKEVSRKHEAEFLRFVEQCSEQKLDHSVWESTPNNYCQWQLSFDENSILPCLLKDTCFFQKETAFSNILS